MAKKGSKVFAAPSTPQKTVYNSLFLRFIHRYWRGGILWGFINPLNFHFYCIFERQFGPCGVSSSQNFSKVFKILKKFRFMKPGTFKNAFLSNSGQIWPFFVKKWPFFGSKTLFLKISAPSAPKFYFFVRLQRPKCGIGTFPSGLHPHTSGFIAFLSFNLTKKIT